MAGQSLSAFQGTSLLSRLESCRANADEDGSICGATTKRPILRKSHPDFAVPSRKSCLRCTVAKLGSCNRLRGIDVCEPYPFRRWRSRRLRNPVRDLPALRPFSDERSLLAPLPSGLGAGAWLASHMLTVVPFVLLPLGLLRVATLSPCDARRTSAPCLRRLERDWHRL